MRFVRTRFLFAVRCGAFLAASAAARPVFACQVCAVTVSYNAFRFLAIWFFLSLVWLCLTVAAGSRSDAAQYGWRRWFRFSAGAVKLHLLSLFLILLGANLFAFLILPVLLLPFAAPDAFRARFFAKSRAVGAPRWLANASRALLLVMIAAVPLSYWALPQVENEPNARIGASEMRRRLAGLDESVQTRWRETGAAPTAEMRGESFAFLPQPKAPFSDAGSADYPAELQADVFGYEPIACPVGDAAMSSGLVLLPSLSMGMHYVGGAPEESNRVQFLSDGEQYLLVSRGPDAEFDINSKLFEAEKVGGMISRGGLADFTYDPTNGSFSSGDIWQAGKFQK